MTTWILVAARDAAHVYDWADSKGPLRPLYDFEYREGKLEENLPAKGAAHVASEHRTHAHLPTGADETHFIKELLHFVERAGAKGEFARLFLVGEAKFLAKFHEQMSPSLKPKVTGDVKKNLGHLSVQELRTHLVHDVFPLARADV